MFVYKFLFYGLVIVSHNLKCKQGKSQFKRYILLSCIADLHLHSGRDSVSIQRLFGDTSAQFTLILDESCVRLKYPNLIFQGQDGLP
jgi:hypothetical protein